MIPKTLNPINFERKVLEQNESCIKAIVSAPFRIIKYIFSTLYHLVFSKERVDVQSQPTYTRPTLIPLEEKNKNHATPLHDALNEIDYYAKGSLTMAIMQKRSEIMDGDVRGEPFKHL